LDVEDGEHSEMSQEIFSYGFLIFRCVIVFTIVHFPGYSSYFVSPLFPTGARGWLRHYAISWKVAGSVPDKVTRFYLG
jgi:hypothetical protein